MFRLNKSSRPILCYVTDRFALPTGGQAPLSALLAKVEAAVAAGIDWIQIREKDLPGRDRATLTHSALQMAGRDRNTPRAGILINDRLDVALTVGAAGVHLGENGLPVKDARRLCEAFRSAAEPPFLVGVSCHSLAAARIAADSGADYLIFGPVFETPSKVGFGPPQGLAVLGDVCNAVSLPVLAIGGVNLQNAASCLRTGAAGIAAIRLFQDAGDLSALVASLHALPLR